MANWTHRRDEDRDRSDRDERHQRDRDRWDVWSEQGRQGRDNESRSARDKGDWSQQNRFWDEGQYETRRDVQRGFERGYGQGDDDRQTNRSQDWRRASDPSRDWQASPRQFSGQPGSGQQDYGNSGHESGTFGQRSGQMGTNESQRFGAGGYSDSMSQQGGSHQAQGGHRGRGPKGYKRSDERIKDDVCEKLTDHHEIDASNIEVDVSSGEVTLNGTVGDRYQRRAAEDCVEQVSGVSHVQNNLRVKEQDQSSTQSTPSMRMGGAQDGAST